jgi:hypothetical protein
MNIDVTTFNINKLNLALDKKENTPQPMIIYPRKARSI